MENKNKSIETVLVITTGLLLFYYFTHNLWLLRAALTISLIGIFLPKVANIIHKGWMLLALGLGWFNGRVLLSLLFFGILLPFAWLAKVFGTPSLQLKRTPENETYYIVRDKNYTKEDLENLF
jgi:hypothetical protein